MTFLKSIILSFSMFSKIPMINVEWSPKNMRYMMCGFPFVGFFIGGFLFILDFLLYKHINIFTYKHINICLYVYAFIYTMFSVFVTGGIHLDGFMDTSDALGSHASIEKKLEILKDSHVGSFAVISVVIYFFAYFVFSICFTTNLIFSENTNFSSFVEIALPFCLVFPTSRFFSALAVAIFPKAKNSGLVHTFADSSAKHFTIIWSIIWLIIIFAFLLFFNLKSSIILFATSILFFLYYFCMSKKQFGGITGDLAGWFVQMHELFCLVTLVFGDFILWF